MQPLLVVDGFQEVAVLHNLGLAFFGKLAILLLVEAAVIGGAQAIRPEQGHQVDALHERVMLAAPMMDDQAPF